MLGFNVKVKAGSQAQKKGDSIPLLISCDQIKQIAHRPPIKAQHMIAANSSIAVSIFI
jgi:hypothetical protein